MATIEDYFSFQVFLIVLRETLELAIIISVLLAFLHQSFSPPADVSTPENETLLEQEELESSDSAGTYRFLRLQVWVGGMLGVVCCLFIGTAILSIFYIIGSDLWSVAEHYWEGCFSIIASVIISAMGIKILRVNKMQQKWKAKLAGLITQSGFRFGQERGERLERSGNERSGNEESGNEGSGNERLESTKPSRYDRYENFSEKYAMFILPFVTTLREGMEAIVFIGGIGINENTSLSAIINAAVAAIAIGSTVGVVLYRTGNSLSLQGFLICSTCFLYLIAAGLFSKGVWNFELQKFIDLCDGFDVSETGHGPGSYDITKSVWHVNCCNGELQQDGAFWMVMTAVLGWTNSATYGSVFSYILYWAVMILVFTSLVFEERNGYLPGIPLRFQATRIRKRLASLPPHRPPSSSPIG